MNASAARPARFWLVAAIAVGAILRLGSLIAYRDFAHGDVVTDAATTRSLADGLGFWTPWEEALSPVDDPIGTTPETFGYPVNAHGPVWPLIAAPIAKLLGDALLALQIASWLAGVAAIIVASRLLESFGPRAALLGAWAVALALPLCDYSGNGSIYAGEVLGVLCLPLAARDLSTARHALRTGALLGLLFLTNYQCVLLIPAFALAAAVVLGVRASVRPLCVAAAACVVVTLPWFLRNVAAFGDPFFTINHFSLHFDSGAQYALDLDGPRPILRIELLSAGEILRGMAQRTPSNFAWAMAAFSLALPVLPLFAPAGFARMTARANGARAALAGWLLLASFAALLAGSILWPGMKARYFVPLAAIAALPACVELALGARFLPALLAAATVLACGWAIGAPEDPNFPWIESRFLVPTLALPLLALAGRGRRALPWIALAAMALHGAFRVAIGLDRSLTSRLFDVPMADAGWRLGPATATFYDIFRAPEREGIELLEDRDRKAAAAALSAAGARIVIGPPMLASAWQGMFVASAFRRGDTFSFDPLSAAIRAFKADAVVFDAGGDRAWLAPFSPELLYEGPRLVAFRVNAP